MRTLCSLLLLAGLAAGWARLSPAASPNPEQADAAFGRLAEEYIAGYLAWRPQTGVILGFHEYDGKAPDYRRDAIAAERTRLKSFDHRLSAVDTNRLSPGAWFDYRILRNAVRRELFAFDRAQVFSQNPMTYAGALDLSVYIKRNFAPLEQRVRSIIAILQQVPALFAAARANLAESLPWPQIETAIEEATGAADFLGKDLVAALKEVKDQALLAEFTAADQRAIAELRGFATWLKEQRLPKANANYALGREKYRELLEYGEMVTATPEQLLEIGLRELRRKQEVFAEAAREIAPGREPIAVFKGLQKDHPTEQSLIPDTARDLEMIRQFVLDHELVTLPSPVRARVAETPRFLRATSFASMDTPGPFDTQATEAYYYVTPVEPDWPAPQKEEWLTAFNYYTTDIVTIHEAYPGHYVQFLCLKASPATKLEKIFSSYAFIEGWAHYAEQMMVDEGFGRGPLWPGRPTQETAATGSADAAAAGPAQAEQVRAAKYRLAQTDEALLRLCRLCVSIQMHCQGMTVEQAAKFFEDNCYYEPKPAREEALRGAYDPEYLYYALGKLEFFKLREDYRKQEGANFSLRKFHDEVLRHGAPPLRLLRELMLKDPALWEQVF